MSIKTKKKSFIYFGLGSILLIFSILLSHKNEQRTNPAYINSYLQEKFLQKENSLKENILSISENKYFDLPQLLKYCDEEKINEDEFIFYIYKDTLLKAWSSNSVVITKNITKNAKNNTLLQIGHDFVYYTEKQVNSYTVVGIYVLKNRAYREHTYISINFLSEKMMHQGIEIQSDEGQYPILNNNGNVIFSITFPDDIKLNDFIVIIELTAWILVFSFLLLGLYWYLIGISFFTEKSNFIWIILGFIIVICSYIVSLLKIPHSVYASDLFSSLYYASFLSSLGELFIYSYAILFFSVLFNGSFRINPERFKHKITKIIIGYLLIIIAISFYIFIFTFQYSIANNSTITIIPILLFKYNGLSFILLFSISSLFWALLVIFRKLFEECYKLFSSTKSFIIAVIIAFVVIVSIVYYFDIIIYGFYYITIIYFFIFITFITIIVVRIVFPKRLSLVVTYTVACALFGLILFFITEHINNQKMERHKEDFAELLLLAEDPFMIFDLCEIEHNIQSDNRVKEFLMMQKVSSDSIRSYINTQYFEKYLEQYKIKINFSQSSFPDNKLIKNNLEQQFYRSDKISKDKNVAFLRMGMGKSLYMIKIIIPFTCKTLTDTAYIFVEMESISNFVKPFINTNPHRIEKELVNLSYAEYVNDTLKNYRETVAPYKLNFKNYNLDTIYSGMHFESEGFIHTIYKAPNRKILLLSTYKDSITRKLSSVSFIFIIILIFGSLPIIINFLFGNKKIQFTLRGQIQQMVIILLLGSSLLGGAIFIQFTISSNKMDIVNNSVYRINFIDNIIISSLNDSDLIVNKDVKNININFISELLKDYIPNVTLYNLHGNQIFINQSIPFETDLESFKMNPHAYNAINNKGISFFMEDKTMRDNKYVVLYKPLRNKKGEVLAYLSYSSLAKEVRMDHQVTGFFSTFLSFYSLFIMIAIIIGALITRYMSKSLMQISNYLAELKLQSVNKKIEWRRNDEIGLLIQEYNRLVDELEVSAELLSRSERESAWKDMAQQVAHEIKNPLTPMKLRTQQIQREVNDGMMDKNKINQYINVLLGQIDILTEITSSFYSLSKMHHGEGEKENLIHIIENVINIHLNQKNYDVVFNNMISEETVFVFINKTQLIRVFNNLIRNAVQAGKDTIKQKIIIHLSDYGGNLWQVKVQDFGIGMDENTLKHVFNPRFTTKSTGMGLGLVIVKNIITDWNGEISVESIVNEGTTFTIMLPKYADKMLS